MFTLHTHNLFLGTLVQAEHETNRLWQIQFPKNAMARHGALWRGDSPYTDIKRLSQHKINELLVNHDKASMV